MAIFNCYVSSPEGTIDSIPQMPLPKHTWRTSAFPQRQVATHAHRFQLQAVVAEGRQHSISGTVQILQAG